MTDEELVRCYRRTRKPECFETLVGRYITKMRRLLFVVAGGEPEDREDLEQEILAELFLALPKFREDSRFSTFLYRFTRNKAIDHLRRRSRQRRHGPLGVVEAGPESDPVGELIAAETAAAVRAALAELPEVERTMLYLKDAEERSIREVAEIVGVPDGTVKSRLSRSRRKLARMLEEAGIQEVAL